MVRAIGNPSPEFDDGIIWKGDDKGHFSLKSATPNNIPVSYSWSYTVWFKGRIPQHSVCAWLAIRDGLKTRALLRSRNV